MAAEVVSIDRDGADAARAALERCVAGGGVALFPSDGVYGLACDPLDPDAIARINRIKGRDERKPAAIMYFDQRAMREVLSGLGPRTGKAVAALLPGAVTLVIANPTHRYSLACGGSADRLGIRLIGGPLAGMPRPIFQTSANRSGQPAPASFDAVDPGIVEGADVAIDGGALPGLASTVVDLTRLDDDGAWTVLREGALSIAALEPRLAPIASNVAADAR